MQSSPLHLNLMIRNYSFFSLSFSLKIHFMPLENSVLLVCVRVCVWQRWFQNSSEYWVSFGYHFGGEKTHPCEMPNASSSSSSVEWSQSRSWLFYYFGVSLSGTTTKKKNDRRNNKREEAISPLVQKQKNKMPNVFSPREVTRTEHFLFVDWLICSSCFERILLSSNFTLSTYFKEYRPKMRKWKYG